MRRLVARSDQFFPLFFNLGFSKMLLLLCTDLLMQLNERNGEHGRNFSTNELLVVGLTSLLQTLPEMGTVVSVKNISTTETQEVVTAGGPRSKADRGVYFPVSGPALRYALKWV